MITATVEKVQFLGDHIERASHWELGGQRKWRIRNSLSIMCHPCKGVVTFFYMSNFSEISGLPGETSCFNSEVWWAMNLICKKLFLFFPLFLYIKWG